MKFLNKSSIKVILLNLIGWGVLGFLGNKLYNDANQIIVAYQELYTTARGKENFRITSDTFNETAEQRSSLEDKDLILFIEKLEGLAKTAGVELKLNEPKSVTGKVIRLDLTFLASGSFASLYYFLTLIENLPYRLEWKTLTWALANGTTWSGNFDLAIISYNNHNVTP